MGKTADVVARRFEPLESSYFLFAPRGTGKTTFLGAGYPNAVRIDLLDPDFIRQPAAFPERLEDRVRAVDVSTMIVIDEVKRAREVLTVVQKVIKCPGYCFVPAGSSARKLPRNGQDLPVGSAVNRTLHSFTATELGDRFDLDRAMSAGTIPLIWTASDAADVLRSYSGTVRSARRFFRKAWCATQPVSRASSRRLVSPTAGGST